MLDVKVTPNVDWVAGAGTGAKNPIAPALAKIKDSEASFRCQAAAEMFFGRGYVMCLPYILSCITAAGPKTDAVVGNS
jgi:hypothetical protein